MNLTRFNGSVSLFVCLTILIFSYTIWPGLKKDMNCYFQLSFVAHADCRQEAATTFSARQNLLSAIDTMENATNEARLQTAAQLMSTSNGFVFLLYMNEAYLDMTKSWICHTEALLPDILSYTVFITTSDALSSTLQSWNSRVQAFAQAYPVAKSVSYGSYEYYRLTEERVRVQNDLIQSGVNVVVIESDAVWTSDKVADYMRSKMKTSEIVSAVADNKMRISAGFVGVRSTEATRDFFQSYFKTWKASLVPFQNQSGNIGSQGEQKTLTEMLLNSTIKVNWLSYCENASGLWYIQKKDPKCPIPMVIQNNFISGNSEKIKRAKHWKHWFLNDKGNCK